MPPSPKNSRRSSLRFKLMDKTITYMAKGQLGKAVLLNISTDGCAVTNCTTSLAANDEILIVIEFTDLDKPLELKAKVIRAEKKRFSAKFTEIEKSFKPRFTIMLANETRISKPLPCTLSSCIFTHSLAR